MVSYTAIGVDTAESRAGILAFSVDTGLVSGTVRVDNTFRSAVRW